MSGVKGLNPTLRRRLNATGTVDSVPKKGKSILEYEEKKAIDVAKNNASVFKQASPDRELERTRVDFAKVGDDSWSEQKTSGVNSPGRFDPSKLTMGNADDKVGLFKDGKMLDPGQRLSGGDLGGTPLPAGQSPFFMKMPAGNTNNQTNYTGLFAQDAKMAGLAMDRAKDGTLPGDFFTGPGEPGPGTYGKDSMMSHYQDRRRQLELQLDEFSRRNPLSAGSSFDEKLTYQLQTKALRDEIRDIDTQIFGRTELANKIQTAMIGQDTAMGVQELENKGKLENTGLEGQYTYLTRDLMERAETERNNAALKAGGSTQLRDYRWEKQADVMKALVTEFSKSIFASQPDISTQEYLDKMKPFFDYMGMGNQNDLGALMDVLEKEEK